LAWNPLSNRIAVAGTFGFLEIVDIMAPVNNIFPSSVEHVMAIDWSPDGTKLAGAVRRVSGDLASIVVLVWDGSTGDAITALVGHSDLIISVRWSPDGSKLASGGAD